MEPVTQPARGRRVAAALALIVGPPAAALGLLAAGLATTTLALVYVSIAASLVAVPAFIAGIVMLVRRG